MRYDDKSLLLERDVPLVWQTAQPAPRTGALRCQAARCPGNVCPCIARRTVWRDKT
jgi:hypothetical protein